MGAHRSVLQGAGVELKAEGRTFAKQRSQRREGVQENAGEESRASLMDR